MAFKTILGDSIVRLRAVPLGLVRRARCEGNPREKKNRPREILGARTQDLARPFLCHARQTKRVTHDRLSDRGTIRSLPLSFPPGPYVYGEGLSLTS